MYRFETYYSLMYNLFMKKFVTSFKWYEATFTFLSIIALIVLGFVFNNEPKYVTLFQLAATISGVLASVLNVKKFRFTFIFYSLYALLYGASALSRNQYGEGVLNLAYNLPLYLFTIYKLYISPKKEEGEFKINSMPNKVLIIVLSSIPLVTLGYGFLLKELNSSYPFINAFATSLALIATFSASRRYKEQWIFWSIYSIILSILWLMNYILLNNGGILYLVLNIIYLVVNIYGMTNWYIEYRNQKKID